MSAGHTIRELMDEFGVTARTLRHYEELGLLHPARAGLSRIYSGRDRARLKVALRGKRLGYTLQEIGELFELYDDACADSAQLDVFLATLEKKRAALEQQRADVEAMLSEIQFFSDHCRRMLHSNVGT
jgi:Predicted transcriptional regulators